MLYDVKIPGQLRRALVYHIRTQGCYVAGLIDELKEIGARINVGPLLALIKSQESLENLANNLGVCPDITVDRSTKEDGE